MPKYSRRSFVQLGAGLAGAAALGPISASAQGGPVKIRYATGGGVGPNEMETIIFLDYLKQNVLSHYGKDYTVDMTFTRGTPEAAALLAAGQADIATLSCSAFALTVTKNAVPGGLTIISDNYQDGQGDNASNSFFVLKDSPIKTVADLKGKKIGINAFGSAIDPPLRVMLKKNGLDPRRDVQIVEVAFPNMASAIREKRVDCGVLVIPFLAAEAPKGDLRVLFTARDAIGSSSVIFQVVTNSFLKANEKAVRAFLADYVQGLAWYYDPANRAKAIDQIADFTKSPKPVLESYFATSRDYYRDRGGCVPLASIQKPIDVMVEEGILAEKVDAAKYFNLGYLPNPCKA